jgi:tetratricopeptide (TPR) repeat protein
MDVEKIEQIERYLAKKMPREESASFEKRLAADASLREEMELIRGIRHSIRTDTGAFRAKIKTILAGEQPDRKVHFSKIRAFRPIYLAAAAVVLLLGFALAIKLIPDKTAAFPEIAASYLETPYPDMITVRGDQNPSPNEAVLSAMDLYNTGNYREASEAFSAILLEKDEPGLRLYLGYALLRSDPPETEKAIRNFRTIMESRDATFREPAHWYLALSYLVSSDVENATRELEDLQSQGNSYSGRAKILLQKIANQN